MANDLLEARRSAASPSKRWLGISFPLGKIFTRDIQSAAWKDCQQKNLLLGGSEVRYGCFPSCQPF